MPYDRYYSLVLLHILRFLLNFLVPPPTFLFVRELLYSAQFFTQNWWLRQPLRRCARWRIDQHRHKGDIYIYDPVRSERFPISFIVRIANDCAKGNSYSLVTDGKSVVVTQGRTRDGRVQRCETNDPRFYKNFMLAHSPAGRIPLEGT